MQSAGRGPNPAIFIMAHARNYIDLTGRRFGRLTILSFEDRNENGNAIWRVRCDCGTNITRGLTRSCGCLRFGNQNAKKKVSRRDAAGAAHLFG